MVHKVVNGDGVPIDPRSAVVPILKEISKGKLSVVGTGFYISRYGLFLTAKHVLDELVLGNKKEIGVGYICHSANNETVHLRRILSVSLLEPADLAVGQSDTYESKYPDDPLMNMRCGLSIREPSEGEELVTYAYPLNEVLDFTDKSNDPVISSNFYNGVFLHTLGSTERPYIQYPHYEASIEIKSGASGGPVFSKGKVIGVNCRGWDFGDGIDKKDHLSSIVPIKELLEMKLGHLTVPKISWEFNQIPEDCNPTNLTMSELVRFGHVVLHEE